MTSATRGRTAPALVAALAIDMLGSGLFMPISLLYFTRVTDLSLTTVGVLISVATFVTLPVPVLVGHLADRWSPRDLVIIAQVAQAAGFAAYGWIRGAIPVLVVSIVVATGQRIFWSSFFTLVAGLGEDGEDDRSSDRRFAMVGMVQAAGTGLGAFVSGLVLVAASTDVYRFVAIANAVSFALSAVLLLRLPRPRSQRREDADQRELGGYRALLRDRPYLSLIAVNCVFALCSVMVGIAVPVYLVEGLPAPSWLVGPLLAVNTVLLATGQSVAVRLARPLSRVRVMVLAGGLWAVWSLVFAAAVRVPTMVLVPYLLAGMVCYAAAELLHAPTSNALASAAAPEHSRGRYLAMFQYCFTIANIVAPTFFTTLYARGPAVPWVVLGVLAAVATVVMHTLEHRLPSGSTVTAPAADGVLS